MGESKFYVDCFYYAGVGSPWHLPSMLFKGQLTMWAFIAINLPPKHYFCSSTPFKYVLSSLLLSSKYFLNISCYSLTYGLFRSELLNFQYLREVFRFFFLLLLIYKIWSVLVNVRYAVEKNVHYAVGVFCCCFCCFFFWARSSWWIMLFISSWLLLIFCQLVRNDCWNIQLW